jgi:hypothetical protein
MDDVLYDGTGLPPEDTEALEQAPEEQEPTPEPAAPENAQSDGDGPPYEGGANLSGPDAGTGTDTPDAVAVPGDDRNADEVEADRNAAGNSGDIASGTYVEGVEVQSDTAGTAGAVNAETGEVTAPGEPLPTIEGTGGTPLNPPQPGADPDGFGGDAPAPAGESLTGSATPLDAPAPFDPEQSEQQPT